MKSKTLLICGGGHASLPALKMGSLWKEAGLEVVLLSSHRYLYYSGAVPQFLGGVYGMDDARIDLKMLCQNYGTVFTEGTVTEIDETKQTVLLSDGQEFAWDFLFINTGVVSRPLSFAHPRLFPVKPMTELIKLKPLLVSGKARKIAVLGGGAAGCEIALNLTAPDSSFQIQLTLFEAGDQILSSFPKKLSRMVTETLTRRGVEIRLSEPFSEEELPGMMTQFDAVIHAAGNIPATKSIRHGLPADAAGRIRVTDSLQCVGHPKIYAAGDAACPGADGYPPIGVHAVKQGVTFRGVMEGLLYGKKLPSYKSYPLTPLILSDGHSGGFFIAGKMAASGRWAIILKYMLDMNWLEKYTHSPAERRSWLKLFRDALAR